MSAGKQSLTMAKAQRILKQFRASPAYYTQDYVLQLEKAIQKDTFRESRCLGMLLLTRSGNDLAKSVKKSRDFALAVAHIRLGIRGYIVCLEALLADLQNVEMRAMSALACRPDDVDEIIREAQRPEGTTREERR